MKTTLLSLLLVLASLAQAQQDPLYSQYLINPLVINPAYAGLNNNLSIMAGYRTQWSGFEGQPQTLTLTAQSSVANNKAGVGMLVVQDKLGTSTTTEVSGAFSYRLQLGETTFSFGMQAGMQNLRTDYSGLSLYDPNDPAFTGNDRVSRFNLGAGVILKSERYFIGLSVPRLLPSTFSNGGQDFQLYNQHLYLFGAYMIQVNEHIRLKPSVLLRNVSGAPLSTDLAFNINLASAHTAGLFTRNFNTFGVLLQTVVKDRFRFGYVFELPTNQSVGTRFTTHEINVGIMLSVLRFQQTTISTF